MARKALAETGTPWADLARTMADYAKGDVDWRDGRTAVYTFNAGEDVHEVQTRAYSAFITENGLGPAAFPSLKRMEAEVLDYALGLLHAPDGAAGAMTSGGTDSITMAVKAARDFHRSRHGDAGPLNIVLPYSAHPAFDKAAMLMDLEVRRVPLVDFLADPVAMEAAIDAGTILMVGSAPCFPYGLIDPIAALSEVAVRRGVWLHVDACVGGYSAPFMRMNGEDVAAFDFELAGVSSMSADLHKYGFCAKGASTVLFRSEALKAFAAFSVDAWPNGKMTTPTLAGTRPGGAIAAAWAVMNYLGVEGYRQKNREIAQARRALEAGARARGLTVLGKPVLGLIAIAGLARPGAVWAAMRARGWYTSMVYDPPALHLMLAPKHAEVTGQYLADLDAAMAEVAAAPAKDGSAPRYGG